MALLRSNCPGYYRYLDRPGITTRARNHSSRTEINRDKSLATCNRTPRHSYGWTHTRANRFTNNLWLQGGYLGNGSATSSSEIARPCIANKHWSTCRWRRQPLITWSSRVRTTKELHGETRPEHSRHFMDNCADSLVEWFNLLALI